MSPAGSFVHQMAALLFLVVSVTAYPNPASQRFYYQISGVPGQQADPYAAALLSHRRAMQTIAQAGHRRPGVYLIPQDSGQEGGTASNNAGYIDSVLGVLGTYWPGSVGQPPAGTEQKPGAESENSVEEQPDTPSAASIPIAVMGSPMTSVIKSPSASAVMAAPSVMTSPAASLIGSPSASLMGSPVAASSFMNSPMMIAAPPVRGPHHAASLQDASVDDDSRPADFQGLLATARLKAAQAAIRAALAAQRGAAAAAASGESQESDGADQEDEETRGPSIAQAKPQAVSVAGRGGVAAAAPIGTAVVGPGGMALSAPQATAVAGTQRRRPTDSPDSADSRIRLSSRIRPDAAAPPFYFY